MDELSGTAESPMSRSVRSTFSNYKSSMSPQGVNAGVAGTIIPDDIEVG